MPFQRPVGATQRQKRCSVLRNHGLRLVPGLRLPTRVGTLPRQVTERLGAFSRLGCGWGAFRPVDAPRWAQASLVGDSFQARVPRGRGRRQFCLHGFQHRRKVSCRLDSQNGNGWSRMLTVVRFPFAAQLLPKGLLSQSALPSTA